MSTPPAGLLKPPVPMALTEIVAAFQMGPLRGSLFFHPPVGEREADRRLLPASWPDQHHAEGR